MKTNLPLNICEKIKENCLKDKISESCGFVIRQNEFLYVIELPNNHPQKENFFVISPLDFLKVKKQGTIEYVYHSHLNNRGFSETDRIYQKYHNINMVVYDISSDSFSYLTCK
jgi:proteasome lid subunit RPN8/RPN11